MLEVTNTLLRSSRHRDFRYYLASSLLANLGAQMLGVAVGWQVYAITHRAIDLGYVGLVQFVPAFLLSLPAGSVADRFDRSRIVALCNVGQAICSLVLLALAVERPSSVAPVFLVLFFVGLARAFEDPAAQALVPGLVLPEHFASAVTWSSSVWQMATIVGPALGGLLYGASRGAAWVYGACAWVFVAASLLAFAVRARSVDAGAERSSWRDVLAGLHFVRDRPVLLEAISLDLFAVLLGGATALLPVYASDVLHVGPRGLGMLRSAPAVGASLLAMVLARRPLTRWVGPITLVSVAMFGAATVVFGLSRSFPLSLASLLVPGASDMVSVVMRSTVVQLRTPHELRGRVSAVSMMCIIASSHLGELESGVTAAWLGVVPAVVMGGVGTLFVVTIYAFVLKTLRSVDRLDNADALPPDAHA
jgi:MFS family permease